MSSPGQRQYVLVGLVVFFTLLTAALLVDVLATVFFATTVAYVLFPVREWLVTYHLKPRYASAVATIFAFLGVAALLAPVGIVLYLRRNQFVDFIQNLPPEITIRYSGFFYTLQTDDAITYANDTLTDLAISGVQAAPVLALKAALFTFLVFAILLEPRGVGAAIFRPIPRDYHDIVMAIHERIRDTLFAIYVLQAATALGTFVLALAVFFLLGYESFFALAVIAGILQFIPIVGPSILVIGLAGYQVSIGEIDAAVAVLVLGLILIAFVPDALIRPRLAEWSADLPGSLYFVGFVGGILSVGVMGFIAGPLVIALLVEALDLLSDRQMRRGTLF
ncbi:AI-2E family transporter [Haladaptatus sp. DYSN1]|uniref:AI-2E family transporter n=1 Tax=unclassified Haladaptatus TaxID=2622732 RepID=UPI0024058424|nr:AI-2E family transporter [Haladaptatus sp. DYSN1]